ncbi:MAG: hypothetical protein FJ109_04790 [Deltaproteobacteria bacterium]|nr:hypothetical protein [Deltaproteobacteria bacterium]
METQAVPLETQGRKRLCIALIACVILAAIGLVIAFELTDVFVRSHTDPDFQSFCAVSEGMNCETVALSEYSTQLGVPVSVWASAGYAFLVGLALLCLARLRDGFGRGFLFLFSCLFALVSLLLVYIMAAKIKSFCILCLALDVVNLGLLAMSLFAVFSSGQTPGDVVAYDFASLVRRPLWPLIVAALGLGALGGGYAYGSRLLQAANGEAQGPATEQKLDSPEEWTSKVHGECGEQCGCEEKKAGTVQMGTDEAGHAWIGSASAPLVIQEFTDYECPYCRKAHMMVRKLLSNHAEDVRVVHRHYPLDHVCNRAVPGPFHKRACELSRIAVCAGRQGRFWEMNDFLFQHAAEIRSAKLPADEIARRLELDPDQFQCCMNDSTVLDALKRDIEEGISLKLEGTPAFVIDGKVYYGKIPDEAVKRLEK